MAEGATQILSFFRDGHGDGLVLVLVEKPTSYPAKRDGQAVKMRKPNGTQTTHFLSALVLRTFAVFETGLLRLDRRMLSAIDEIRMESGRIEGEVCISSRG